VPLYGPLIYLPNSARLHLPFDWILHVMCFNFHALLFSSASCSCMVIVLWAQIWLKWLPVYHLKGPHLILSQHVWSTLGRLTPHTHTVTMGFLACPLCELNRWSLCAIIYFVCIQIFASWCLSVYWLNSWGRDH